MHLTKSTVVFKANSRCENCWLGNFSTYNGVPSQVKIIASKQEREYSKGEYLMKAGDPVFGIYCIKKGIVKISKKGTRNKEFILWIARSGDVVGLNSFINEEAFSFSASAIDDVSACFIPATDLKLVFNKEPIVFVQLMRRLCEKLNFIEQRITSISRKSVKAQCAEMLMTFAAQTDPLNSSSISIDYSISDLASLVGTTKNYMYKIIGDFIDKKIVTINNRKLIVNNINSLSAIAIGNDK